MVMTATKTIWRIELWHLGLLLVLLAVLTPVRLIDPSSLLAGGLFMGANFLLLCYGVAWILTPLAGKGKIKAGVALLVLKVLLFLGLLSLLFFNFGMDAISFAAGFSTLLIAIVIETMRNSVSLRA
jgi:Kef-type K+ transport system membrane component KefB